MMRHSTTHPKIVILNQGNAPEYTPEENRSEPYSPRQFQEQFPAWLPPLVNIGLQHARDFVVKKKKKKKKKKPMHESKCIKIYKSLPDRNQKLEPRGN
ncbi:hypothetical protein HanRHA438_Chr15g0731661 [Helianthus annuus]|nr:hypothetical protein HanRHA438_Chr15g0731661 [Helianthus annuus]